MTDLFAASTKSFDHLAIESEWEWRFGTAVRTHDWIARTIWSHFVVDVVSETE